MEKTFVRIRSVVLFLTALSVAFFTLSLGIFDRIVLADGEKAPITMDMLRRGYEQHYDVNKKMSTIMIVFLIIAILIIIAVIVAKIAGLRRLATVSKLSSIITIISMSVVLLVLLVILAVDLLGMATNVSPDKASYRLETETVIRTEAEEHIDEDGDTTYTYYVYLADDRRDSGEKRRLIDKGMYDTISEPGEYYFAEAYSGKISSVFAVYPASGYEPAPDIEVT